MIGHDRIWFNSSFTPDAMFEPVVLGALDAWVHDVDSNHNLLYEVPSGSGLAGPSFFNSCNAQVCMIGLHRAGQVMEFECLHGDIVVGLVPHQSAARVFELTSQVLNAKARVKAELDPSGKIVSSSDQAHRLQILLTHC